MSDTNFRFLAALGAALVALPAAADSSFYGRANISLQQYEAIDDSGVADVMVGTSTISVPAARTAEDNWQMNSNASRLGFKGSQDLENGMQAIFKIEYEVAFDRGDFSSDELKARNIYGGFKGDWGQLIIGRNDTPYKSLGTPVDVFNDYDNGDIRVFLNGEDRRNNMLYYQSPEISGFRFGVAVSPGEESGADDDDNSGLTDYVGLSAEYEFGEMFAVGLALNNGMNDSAASMSGLLNGSRFTARLLDWQGHSAGLLVQSLEDDAGSQYFEESATVLSAAYKTGDWKFKMQIGSSEQEILSPAPSKKEWSQTALAAEHSLGDGVMWFVYYSAVENDSTESHAVPHRSSLHNSTVTLEDTTFGVGMEYKF